MSKRTTAHKGLPVSKKGSQFQVASPTGASTLVDRNGTIGFPHETNAQAYLSPDLLAHLELEPNPFRSVLRIPSERAAAIHMVEKEIETIMLLLGTLRTRRNALAPIFLLPPSFLREYFIYLRLRSHLGPEIELWAGYRSRIISGSPTSIRWIAEMLARAKNALLDINLLGTPTVETISMFPPHLSHTRELRLRGLSGIHADSVKELCGLEAPALEHFELGLAFASPVTAQELSGARLFKGKAPKLRTLSLCQVCIPWTFIPRSQLSQLRVSLFEEVSPTASIGVPASGSFNQLMDVLLSHSSTLEDLVLEFCLPSTPFQSSQHQTVHLPRLSHLGLRDRLHLHCSTEDSAGHHQHQIRHILPLISAHFNNRGSFSFRSFRASLNYFERVLDMTASSASPPSTIYPSRVFEGDLANEAEFTLSFDTQPDLDPLVDVLRRACATLPIKELEFLSISAPEVVHSLDWDDLFRRCVKITTIQLSGHGTSAFLRTITPPKIVPKRGKGNNNNNNNNNATPSGSKGKKRQGNRDSGPSQAVDKSHAHTLVFPKLTSLLLRKLNFSGNVPNAGAVYDVLRTRFDVGRPTHPARARIGETRRGIPLEWRRGPVVVRGGNDEFDEYTDFGEYGAARWEDFFVGTSQAEWEWWENYSDGW
ncbi:hypothetical protein B0F90DRAFT_1819623 [Multifurca ochricompacta]|uniref:Uncharacterized protein n=1 Tax=Multifurca ochricompacta TaxID=376703 RepID=A0AAD4M0K3_9AGAM|nr:hypothetical protein B0F90DRAFT_1819623 [Multifurca ochricompacta]